MLVKVMWTVLRYKPPSAAAAAAVVVGLWWLTADVDCTTQPMTSDARTTISRHQDAVAVRSSVQLTCFRTGCDLSAVSLWSLPASAGRQHVRLIGRSLPTFDSMYSAAQNRLVIARH